MSEFINKEPEAILQDIIALFQSNSGTTLNDADPERILIDIMAYREVLTRNQMEWLMNQNFVQLASGTYLDYWGALFGVTRNTDETDESYRTRILSANKAIGIGTKEAYKAKILSLDNVADVLIFSKNDDLSLLPGRVRIIPLKQVVDNDTQIAAGYVHNLALETEITTAICTDDFGVIGNVFQFESAVPVVLDGEIRVTKLAGYDSEQFAGNIEFQIARYFGQLSLQFDNEFGLADITSYLGNAEGLQQIVSLNFQDVPELATGEFYKRGNITVIVE